MILRKHIPNFCSGCVPKQWEVNNKEELLALDEVVSWATVDDSIPFYQYSQCKYGEEYLLIIERKNEEHHLWWVIGYLSEDVGLPEFTKIE